MDQARSRGRGRHDGSHRLRRDALRRTTIDEGLAKASPLLFQGANHPARHRRRRRISPVELLVPHLPVARAGARRAPGARTQSSAAVSADGAALVPAQRLARRPRPARPHADGRAGRACATCRSRAWSLTDAELDHTLGVVLLREGAPPPALRHRAPCSASSSTTPASLPVTARLRRGAAASVCRSAGSTRSCYRDGCPERPHRRGLRGARRSAPLRHADELPGHTVGLIVRDEATGGACAFVPGCGGLDDALLARLARRRPGALRRDLLDRRRADRPGHRRAHRAARWTTCRCRGPDGSLERLASLSGPAPGLHAHQQHQPHADRGLARARLVERAGSRSAPTACGSPSDRR